MPKENEQKECPKCGGIMEWTTLRGPDPQGVAAGETFPETVPLTKRWKCTNTGCGHTDDYRLKEE